MSDLLFITLILASTFAATAVFEWILIPILRRKGSLDNPNHRSSHTIPTPRGGGLAIMACALLAIVAINLFTDWLIPWSFVIAVAAISIIGFLDDFFKGLPVVLRLTLQLLISCWVVWETGGFAKLPLPAPLDLELGYFGYLLSVIWILGVVNIYNFLDGIDGYAGSQGALGGAALLLFFGFDAIGITGGIVMAACLAFLLFNWHPSKVFMGDGGATGLGFLFAILPFYSSVTAVIDVGFVVLIALWFFIMDGALVIVRRLLKGQKVWQPHRMHLYQKLVRTGWKHNRMTVLFIAMSICLIAAQYIAVELLGEIRNWIAFGLGLLMIAGYYLYTRSQVIKFGKKENRG